MGKILDDLFEALAQGKEFEQLDSMLAKEYEERMEAAKGQFSPQEYEQMRDAAFSMLYLGKKAFFKMGFREAIRLVMELSI